MKLEWLLGYPGEPRRVEDLHGRDYNFDSSRLRELVAEQHWHHDDRRQALPGEPPGDPVPDGSFERAKALMRDYEFSEGSAVHAIFEEDAPGTVLYIPLESYGLKKGIDWTPYPIYYFDPRAYNLKVTT